MSMLKNFSLTLFLVGVGCYKILAAPDKVNSLSTYNYAGKEDPFGLSYEVIETEGSISSSKHGENSIENPSVPTLIRKRRTVHHNSLYGVHNQYGLLQKPVYYVQPVQPQQQYYYQPQYHHQPYVTHFAVGGGKDLSNSHTQAQAVATQLGGKEWGTTGITGSSASAVSYSNTNHQNHYGQVVDVV